MAPVRLIVSPDEYLLEQAVAEAVTEACSRHNVEAEELPDDASPADLAFEIRSPSLFASARVLVAPRATAWVAPAPRRRRGGGAEPESVEAEGASVGLEPLLEAIAEGIPGDLEVVLGACSGAAPKGALAEAVAADGGDSAVTWLPLPEKPKPWEEVAVSAEQARVLRGVVGRAAPGARFEPGAEELLFERLGFDPRRLSVEAAKLASAAGTEAIDEELVRRLVLPHERSLRVVEAAVLERRAAPVLELLTAAERGESVLDWRDEEEIAARAVPTLLLGQLSNLLVQLLAVRAAAVAAGLGAELDPGRCGERFWYPRRFKSELGPQLEKALADDPDRLHARGRRSPSIFQLGGLFAGAARWPEADLVAALTEVGEAEANLRGTDAPAAMAVLVARWLRPHGAGG